MGRGESLQCVFLTWFVYSAESIFLICHHGELSCGQTLLLSCGVYHEYGASQRVTRIIKDARYA